MLAHRPTPHLRRAALAATAAAALVSLAACGSGSASPEAAANNGDGSGSTGGGVAQVNVTLANDGGNDACSADVVTAPAGPVTFTVTNESATGITEFEVLQDQRIVGEKESLAPGLDPVSFTVTLDGGDYSLYCPGAAEEMVPFTVTGTVASTPASSTQALLKAGTKTYGDYVDTQVAAMVDGAKKLDAAVKSGDLASAQAAYANARIFYERVESDVDGFILPGTDPTDNSGNLDYLIDMRASNLDPAVGWSGFHAVERDLFQAKKITAKTKAYAATLASNVSQLSDLVKTLSYKPEDLANGAAGLLEEVQANKITGEEEAYSHIDLVDFAGNLEGAQQSFANLEAGLKKIDPTLTATIAQRFDTTTALLETYRDKNALGGYRTYTAALRKSDGNKLSQTVQSLQDSLSRLAEKVATA